jgi:hypothetical protein
MTESTKPKTPAKGPIEYPSPPAATQEEIQESWHKAKNYAVPIAFKKDEL